MARRSSSLGSRRTLAVEALLLIALGAVLGYSAYRLGFRFVGPPTLEGPAGRETHCRVTSAPGAVVVPALEDLDLIDVRVRPSEVSAGGPLLIEYSVRTSASLDRLRESLGGAEGGFDVRLTGQGAEACLEGGEGYVHYLYLLLGGGERRRPENLSGVVIYARLRSSVYLMDESGRVVWRATPDFIHGQQFSSQGGVSSATDWLTSEWSESLAVILPDLPDGEYSLAVRVEDLLTNATEVRVVRLRVRAGSPWEEFQPRPIQAANAREALGEFLKWARSSGWRACYHSEGYEWSFELGRALPAWASSALLVREEGGSCGVVVVRLLLLENSSVAREAANRAAWGGDTVREVVGLGDCAWLSFIHPGGAGDPNPEGPAPDGGAITLILCRGNAVAVLASEEWNLSEGSLGAGCRCAALGEPSKTRLATEDEIIALGRLLDVALELSSDAGG